MSTQGQRMPHHKRVRQGCVVVLIGLLMACLLIPTTALGQTTGGTPTVTPVVPAATATPVPAATATPVPTAPPAPSLSLSVQQGAPGTNATATGGNFRPGETVVITFSGQQVASSTANTSGGFVVSFVVPALGPGENSVGARGQSSAAVVQSTFTITGSSAGLTLSSSQGSVTTAVTLSGTGYQAGETVQVTFDGTEVAEAVAVTDGTFSIAFKIPNLPVGPYTVAATGQTSGASSSTAFTIANPSALLLTPVQGPPQVAVAMAGTGFQAGETVQLSMSGTALGSVQANASGAFTQSFQVPNLPPAQDLVTATGQTSGFSASAPFAVTAATVAPAPTPAPAPTAPPAPAPVAAAADMTAPGYACSPGTSPAFDQGFLTLQGFIGAAIGQARTCPYADPAGTGDTEQNTTLPTGAVGLAFWRKCANTDSFTDGYNHWAYTNTGVQVMWTGVGLPPDPPNTILSPADQASYATCGTT